MHSRNSLPHSTLIQCSQAPELNAPCEAVAVEGEAATPELQQLPVRQLRL